MNFLRKIGSKKSTTGTSKFDKDSINTSANTNSRTAAANMMNRNINDINTPSRTSPTRRPRANGNANFDPPPAYSADAPARNIIHNTNNTTPSITTSTTDSPYAFLSQFDTVFLIDDSGSMAGRSWRETSAALSAITPICTAHDADGLDIYFLNHRSAQTTAANLGGYQNVRDVAGVSEIFNSVRPMGGTPTGTRLHQILKPYLSSLELQSRQQSQNVEISNPIKPLNIIVITDGVPSDDVESVILSAARRLDSLSAEPWQVGIQFFQVGREPEAAEELRELDDALSATHGVRDIVDTVPWSDDSSAAGGEETTTLTAEGLLKVVLGSVNRRLDRRRGSDERLRQ